MMTSSDLSRCPLAMMQGRSTAIIQGLEGQGGLECEHGEPEHQPAMASSVLALPSYKAWKTKAVSSVHMGNMSVNQGGLF